MNWLGKSGQSVGVILPKRVDLAGWHGAGLRGKGEDGQRIDDARCDWEGRSGWGCCVFREFGWVVGKGCCFSGTGVLTWERR
jgi:hypothetical protein